MTAHFTVGGNRLCQTELSHILMYVRKSRLSDHLALPKNLVNNGPSLKMIFENDCHVRERAQHISYLIFHIFPLSPVTPPPFPHPLHAFNHLF